MKKIGIALAFWLALLTVVELLPSVDNSIFTDSIISSPAYAAPGCNGTCSSSNSRSSSSSRQPTPPPDPTPPGCCKLGGSTCDMDGMCQSPPSGDDAGSGSSCSASSSSSAGPRLSQARAAHAKRVKASSKRKKPSAKKGSRLTKELVRLAERPWSTAPHSSLYTISKKKKKCADGCELPEGCTVLKGTQEDAEWMQCYRDAGAPLHELCCNTCDAVAPCWMDNEDEADIVEECNAKETLDEKLACVYAKVKSGLDSEENVCRHYAECVEDILGQMGIGTDFEVGCTGIFNCHAWVEVVDDKGCTTVIDSYNGISYKCCPPAE